MRKSYPIKLLRKYLKKWQKKLHLSDWKISLKIDKSSFSQYSEVAYNMYSNVKKKSKVCVMKKALKYGIDDDKYWETIICHELIHLCVDRNFQQKIKDICSIYIKNNKVTDLLHLEVGNICELMVNLFSGLLVKGEFDYEDKLSDL